MKVWFITGANVQGGSIAQALESGQELLKKYNIEAEHYGRFEIDYTVTSDGEPSLYARGEKVSPPDKFVFYGSFDAVMEGIEEALVSMGSVSVNPIESKRIAGNKLKTAHFMAREGIPQAKVLPIFRSTPVDIIEKEIGIPCVVKPAVGFGGAGVELLKTREEVQAFLDTLPEIMTYDVMIAQPYIESSKGRDLRVLMVGKKPYAAFVRQAGDPKEFRSNIHQGGHYEDFELTDEVVSLCEKTAEAINLNMCGLDLLFGEDGFILGEVNDSPGLKTLVEKVGFEKFLKAMMSA